MITGFVNAFREALVALRIKGPTGIALDCEAVVDTGYSGVFSLPAIAISALKLQKSGVVLAILGDGSETTLDTYEATIEWDGKDRLCTVDVAGEPMIGTTLLADYELRILFVAQGSVEITSVA